MEGSRLAEWMLLTNRKAIWENSLGNALSQPVCSKPGTVIPRGKKKEELVGER